MIIGIPKERKELENRVAITPGTVEVLTNDGHEVWIETKAGEGSSFTDEEYIHAGAEIKEHAADVWSAEMVMKVKEPLKSEYDFFYDGLILFTYLHLAPEVELTNALMEHNVTAVAYETMAKDGALPLLTPMSEVAGRYAVQVGSRFLEKPQGGKGILLGGVPGTAHGQVVIIGGGVAGLNAANIALGMGADVTVLDLDQARLAELDTIFEGRVNILMSNPANIAQSVKNADLVISSVLIAGAKAPTLVTEEMVKEMEAGSVVVDISIDQGGNFETSTHATTHDNPVYTKHGILHYTVANIPGAVPQTSTKALTNVTTQYAKQIAGKGIKQAALENETILTGINTYRGHLTNPAVAKSQERDGKDARELLEN